MSQQINLFNPIFLKQKKIFTAVHMAQTLGALAAGVLLLALYGAFKTSELAKVAEEGKAAMERREARLAAVSKEFVPRKKSAALEAEVARMQAELQSLREAQAVLERGDLGNTAGYSEYFRAFARRNVHGVWLTGMTIVGAGKDVAVEGRALQPELVPNYIQGLTREAVLQGKTFGSLEISRPGEEGAAAPAYIDFRLLTQPLEERK